MALAAIAGGFLLAGLVLPTGADLPIGDSWSYAWSAQQLCEGGVVRLGGFVAMSLVGQLLLTAPVCALFSSDFHVLNLFTYVVSMLTTMLAYLSLRGLGAGVRAALLGAGAIALNPVYLMQSNTYETEIYFLFASLLGIASLVAWDREERPWQIGLAVAAFSLAVLIRQHALSFFVAGLACSAGRRERRWLPLAWAPILIVLLLFHYWLTAIHGVPLAFRNHQEALRDLLADPARLAREVFTGSVQCAHYLGLFLLPLLPILVDRCRALRIRFAAVATVALAILLGTWMLLRSGESMPYLPNVVTVTQVLAPFGRADLPRSGRLLLTGLTAVAGIVAASWLLSEVWSQWRASRDDPRMGARRFLLISAVLLLLFTLVSLPRFDRYLLVPFVLLVLVALAGPVRPGRVLAGWAILAPIGLFSLYFVEERIRSFECSWLAAQDLMAAGYAPEEIDSDWAFNSYYGYVRFPEQAWQLYIRPQRPKAMVRGMLIPHPYFERIGSRVCESRWGSRPYEFHLYERTGWFRAPAEREPSTGRQSHPKAQGGAK